MSGDMRGKQIQDKAAADAQSVSPMAISCAKHSPQ
jgi:hypothetical protein